MQMVSSADAVSIATNHCPPLRSEDEREKKNEEERTLVNLTMLFIWISLQLKTNSSHVTCCHINQQHCNCFLVVCIYVLLKFVTISRTKSSRNNLTMHSIPFHCCIFILYINNNESWLFMTCRLLLIIMLLHMNLKWVLNWNLSSHVLNGLQRCVHWFDRKENDGRCRGISFHASTLHL